MIEKQITESELFKKLNILMLNKNKDHLEVIKEKMSLLCNIEVDNSAFLRGVIEYYYDNPDKLKDLIPYVKAYKGYNILSQFQELVEKGKSKEEITQELGLGLDIVESAFKKLNIKED